MALAVTGISPSTVLDHGGDLVTATGTFVLTHPVTVEVKTGQNPDVWTPCYTPISVPVETTAFPFTMPPLVRGGQYSFRFKQNGEEAQLSSALYVTNRPFVSSTQALRSTMPLFNVGPHRLEDTDPLPIVDVEAPKLAINWPVTPQFLIDADLPGAGGLPMDLGAQAFGTFAVASGTPTFTPSPGSTPGYWHFTHADSESYELTVNGADVLAPFTSVMLFMHETGNTDTIMDAFYYNGGVPYHRTVGGSPVSVRVNNLVALSTGTARDLWEAQVFHVGASPFPLDNYSLRSDQGPASLASGSINRADFSGGPLKLGVATSNYFGGKISLVCCMPGLIAPSVIKAAIVARFSGIFP